MEKIEETIKETVKENVEEIVEKIVEKIIEEIVEEPVFVFNDENKSCFKLILLHMNFWEVITVSKVCKDLYNIANEDDIWKNISISLGVRNQKCSGNWKTFFKNHVTENPLKILEKFELDIKTIDPGNRTNMITLIQFLKFWQEIKKESYVKCLPVEKRIRWLSDENGEPLDHLHCDLDLENTEFKYYWFERDPIITYWNRLYSFSIGYGDSTFILSSKEEGVEDMICGFNLKMKAHYRYEQRQAISRLKNVFKISFHLETKNLKKIIKNVTCMEKLIEYLLNLQKQDIPKNLESLNFKIESKSEKKMMNGPENFTYIKWNKPQETIDDLRGLNEKKSLKRKSDNQ